MWGKRPSRKSHFRGIFDRESVVLNRNSRTSSINTALERVSVFEQNIPKIKIHKSNIDLKKFQRISEEDVDEEPKIEQNPRNAVLPDLS